MSQVAIHPELMPPLQECGGLPARVLLLG
jgi:hypothetical protein